MTDYIVAHWDLLAERRTAAEVKRLGAACAAPN